MTVVLVMDGRLLSHLQQCVPERTPSAAVHFQLRLEPLILTVTLAYDLLLTVVHTELHEHGRQLTVAISLQRACKLFKLACLEFSHYTVPQTIGKDNEGAQTGSRVTPRRSNFG